MFLDILPLLGTIFYLYISNYLKKIYIIQKQLISNPNGLHYFSILHNCTLTAFSSYTFVSLCKVLLFQGIHAGHNIYMSQPYIKSLIFWFYISKYYEYFDTFLLYLKGRNPIFLQKFHHIGAVICWHVCYKNDVDFILFGTLFNSCVHSIMYFYYLMTLFKINIRGIRIFITTGQILQLSVGGFCGLYFFYPPVETVKNYNLIIFFNIYIACLLYLFGEFMLINYFIPMHKSNIKRY
jgi:hypothetical protein